jgi:methyl-accepting chemotaxis protein
MRSNSAEVVQNINNIACVSEENSAAIEEISASTEEMTSKVKNESSSAKSLAIMAQELNRIIGQFKLAVT